MQHVGPLVDHFTFNDDGKITMMRAFWKYADVGRDRSRAYAIDGGMRSDSDF